MNLLKQLRIVVIMLAVLAVAAGIVGDIYKVAWVANWLAPIVKMLFVVGLWTLCVAPPKGVIARKGMVVWLARWAVLNVLVLLFLSIDLVGEAPVSMRLMGLSWTMSPYRAGLFLEVTGFVLGGIACGMAWMDHHRDAAASALAKVASGQSPSVPPAAPTT